MRDLPSAIARVRSFFEPPTVFGSGVRIFEPDRSDTLAPKKRAIISFAVRTAEAFERGKLHSQGELALLEKEAHKFDRCINDAEAQEYRSLLEAVHELIVIGGEKALP